MPQPYLNKRAYHGPNRGMLSGNPLGKNPSDVWTDIPQVHSSHPERTGHPAQMPLALAERAILMTTKPGDLVVDPHAGAGTSVVAAVRVGRTAAGADLSAEYLAMGVERLQQLRDGTLKHRPAGEPIRPRRGPMAAV